MAKTVAIGIQSFDKMIQNNCFYVDKTDFIREWWESGDEVTLIARPRRFGKTLNMSMLRQFFSVEYADRGDLFEGLSIWKEEKYGRMTHLGQSKIWQSFSVVTMKRKLSSFWMNMIRPCRRRM